MPYDFHRLPDSNVYYFVHYEKVTNEIARKTCVEFGSDLGKRIDKFHRLLNAFFTYSINIESK